MIDRALGIVALLTAAAACAGPGAADVDAARSVDASAVDAEVDAAAADPLSYLKASNPGANDMFGFAVAISGETLVVGALNEASSATGVGGNQADDSAPGSGAVYVFVRTGGAWTQQAYLKASNTGTSDSFGFSVALSGDTLVVGAEREDSSATGVNGDQTSDSAFTSGAAYVFVRTGSTWSQQAYLKASNTGTDDLFGFSVAVSGDTIVVGAPLEASNATGIDSTQTDNSIPFAGAAYVFTRTGIVWSQQAYLKASNTGADNFGGHVAIAGDTIAVGAIREASNATGIDGNQADDSAVQSGAVYVFTRAGSSWSQQAYLKASNTAADDSFASAVSLSGDTLAVGAFGEASAATGVDGNQSDDGAAQSGAAYVFTRSAGIWAQQAYLKAPDSAAGAFFGDAIAIDGDAIVVGALRHDAAAVHVGAAYRYVRTGVTWSHQAVIAPAVPDANDSLGQAVGVSGQTSVAGAGSEDSSATGVGGDQTDDGVSNAGAVYVLMSP